MLDSGRGRSEEVSPYSAWKANVARRNANEADKDDGDSTAQRASLVTPCLEGPPFQASKSLHSPVRMILVASHRGDSSERRPWLSSLNRI